MRERHYLLSRLGIVLMVAALFVLAAAPAMAAPPRGKHFAIVLMLNDPETGEIDAAPACLSFSKSEMCTEADDCGPWEFVKKAGHQNEWRGTLEFLNEDGMMIRAETRGITERSGAGNSIGGTAQITAGDIEINAGFGGTQVTKIECLEFGLTDD